MAKDQTNPDSLMRDYPKTRPEAEAFRYNKWSGNPKGTQWDPSRCAEQVAAYFGRWPSYRQCWKKPGHGPSGLYCWLHAKGKEA